MESSRKKIDEILGMSEKDLMLYLRETDDSLKPEDVVQITAFEHGIKATYYHKGSPKPFKTRVFLKNFESSDVLK